LEWKWRKYEEQVNFVVRVMAQPGMTPRKELLVPKDANAGLKITTFISVRI